MSTSGDLKDLFRREMKDTVAPYLWSDDDVYLYIDDAQKMFCRLTDGIADATTSDVTALEVSAGDTWLDLHPSILKIRTATRDSDGRPLDVINHEDLPALGVRLDGTTGALESLIVGMEENKARLLRTAAADDSISLTVFRLPLVDITDDQQDLEIPAQHHIHLLDWVKSLALLKEDAETFDRNKSQEMDSRFRMYCARVRIEQANKRHKVRVVQYGGI